ncbi:hypothetical protein SDC9_81911 [bioreactor metagenome]|uniref:Uncharacterized protein n=1 Tax=bioreactor metagenome TaxID=1076179 RepID=A0A644Z5P2_9ZZZZ
MGECMFGHRLADLSVIGGDQEIPALVAQRGIGEYHLDARAPCLCNHILKPGIMAWREHYRIELLVYSPLNGTDLSLVVGFIYRCKELKDRSGGAAGATGTVLQGPPEFASLHHGNDGNAIGGIGFTLLIRAANQKRKDDKHQDASSHDCTTLIGWIGLCSGMTSLTSVPTSSSLESSRP